MSGLKQFISEIHRRSLWQVLLIYVGGGWLVFEVVQTVTEGLGLPQWFPAFAALLLLVGLPVVVATAFVREGGPEAAVSDPTLIPVGESRTEAVRKRRLLTWRNAGLSFMAALAVWGVVATGWLVFDGESTTPAVSDERPSVAVLPLVNRSGLEQDSYFTNGIHDEILTQLSKISGLSVRARTSVMEYRDSPKNVRQIGEELNARYLLEGGVQRAGGTVRINVQLVDSQSDEHVFAETYDRELSVENLLAVQRDLALRIAEALKATLSAQERDQIERRLTDNIAAYEYYLRGRNFDTDDEQDVRAAILMYESAVQLDSGFALAYASLSIKHSQMFWEYFDRSLERLTLAEEYARRALELDPTLPEGHLALGYYHYRGHQDYRDALAEFAIARESQPNNARLFMAIGSVERRLGRFEDALASLQRAMEIDSRSAQTATELAITHVLLRHYREAQTHFESARTLSPQRSQAYAWAAWALLRGEGESRRARSLLREAESVGAVDHDYYLLAWHLVDLIDGTYQNALDRLATAPWTAIDHQFHYVPKTLCYAQVHSLLRDSMAARAYFDSARIALETRVREYPTDERLHSALGVVYAGTGLKEEAIRQGLIGVELMPPGKDAFKALYRIEDLTLIYTMVGEYDLAIDRLEYLLSAPGDISVSIIRRDPRWAPLRNHPRFRALLKKYE